MPGTGSVPVRVVWPTSMHSPSRWSRDLMACTRPEVAASARLPDRGCESPPDIEFLRHLLDGVQRGGFRRDEDQREAGVLRVLEVLTNLGGSFGSVFVPPPMIVMPAASIFARRARVVSGGSVRGRCTSLNVMCVMPRALRHVERLIERELPARIGRDAELRCGDRLFERRQRSAAGSASARRLKVPTESAVPTNARRVSDASHFRSSEAASGAWAAALWIRDPNPACLEFVVCRSVLFCDCRCRLSRRSAHRTPTISLSQSQATKNFISRAARWSQKPDRPCR